jgi:hypothetical protein
MEAESSKTCALKIANEDGTRRPVFPTGFNFEAVGAEIDFEGQKIGLPIPWTNSSKRP